MIIEKERYLSGSSKIYFIADPELLELLMKSNEIHLQHVSGSSFAFPRKYGHRESIKIDDQHKMIAVRETVYLLGKHIDAINSASEEVKERMQIFLFEKEQQRKEKFEQEKRKRRKKLIMQSRNLDDVIQMPDPVLLQLIRIYIEKFKNFYPFEPDFTFETTQRGYIRSVEYSNKVFEATIDIPRTARTMTEKVIFQRSKAIDIVLRYYKNWRYFHDVVYYVQKHPEKMKNIDWEIANQDLQENSID